jgi:hypothetical protein
MLSLSKFCTMTIAFGQGSSVAAREVSPGLDHGSGEEEESSKYDSTAMCLEHDIDHNIFISTY